ncbi:glycosyl transferase family 2 [Geomonas sp. Red276]
MDISVIICTYNRCDSLRITLCSLFALHLSDDISAEIIVIDNNSKDDTRQVVEEFAVGSPLPVRYFLESRQGLSFARNRGIEEARGEVLAFIDDDVIVDRTWLKALAAAYRDPQVSCVGGKIHPRWEIPCPNWLRRELHNYLALLDLGQERIRMTEPRLWGANLSFRAHVFQRYGAFATGLGRTAGKLYGMEEVNLVKRLIDAGEGVYYVPEVFLRHCIGANRMQKAYFRKWEFDAGELEGLLLGDYPHRNLFGVPLFEVKETLRIFRRWLAARLTRSEKSFCEELSLVKKAGFMSGRLKVYRSPKTEGGMA